MRSSNSFFSTTILGIVVPKIVKHDKHSPGLNLHDFTSSLLNLEAGMHSIIRLSSILYGT